MLESLFKKTLLVLTLFISLFFVIKNEALAECSANSSGSCSEALPFLCTNQVNSSQWCCESGSECNLPPHPTLVDCGNIVTDSNTCSSICPRQTITAPDGTDATCCGWVYQGGCFPSPASCGTVVENANSCSSQCPRTSITMPNGSLMTCCGIANGTQCTAPPTEPPANDEQDPSDPLLPNDSFLIMVNPLTFTGSGGIIGAVANLLRFRTPAAFLNRLIPYLFTFAGLILFVMLLWGGFEMLSGAATPKSQEAGKQRITAALTGFALLFMSYWFAQIIEYIFGLNIL